MLAIFNKELRSYFLSATAYIFMGIFLLFSGLFFAMYNILGEQPNTYYNGVISSLHFIFLLIVPILTMRIIADETKSRTDQLLLTSPVTISKIVFGKYFAAVALFLITLLVTTAYPIILALYAKVAVLEIFAAYVGFFLMGACFISVGVFISSLTDSQVVAAVGTFGALLIIWILDMIKQLLPSSRLSGIIFAGIIVILLCIIIYFSVKNLVVAFSTAILGAAVIGSIFMIKKEFFEGFINKFFGWFSLIERNNVFSMGVLSLNSVVYYLSFSFIFVFLTIRIIEKRRWS